MQPKRPTTVHFQMPCTICARGVTTDQNMTRYAIVVANHNHT